MKLAYLILIATCMASTTRAQNPGELTEEEGWSAEPITDDVFQLPTSPERAARIDTMIARLGDPDHKLREQATRELIATEFQAYAKLRQAYRAPNGLEVRLRIEDIVRKSYLNHFVFGRNAFLGVRQTGRLLTNRDDPGIPVGTYGVEIAAVLPNTSAEAAGMKSGDVVLALDGHPLTRSGQFSAAKFGDLLRRRGPGTLLTITLFRSGEELNLDVVLGSRPQQYYGGSQGTVSRMLTHFSRTFDQWWTKHFDSAPTAAKP